MEQGSPEGEREDSESSEESDPHEDSPQHCYLRHHHLDSISQAEEESEEELTDEPTGELVDEPTMEPAKEPPTAGELIDEPAVEPAKEPPTAAEPAERPHFGAGVTTWRYLGEGQGGHPHVRG